MTKTLAHMSDMKLLTELHALTEQYWDTTDIRTLQTIQRNIILIENEMRNRGQEPPTCR